MEIIARASLRASSPSSSLTSHHPAASHISVNPSPLEASLLHIHRKDSSRSLAQAINEMVLLISAATAFGALIARSAAGSETEANAEGGEISAVTVNAESGHAGLCSGVAVRTEAQQVRGEESTLFSDRSGTNDSLLATDNDLTVRREPLAALPGDIRPDEDPHRLPVIQNHSAEHRYPSQPPARGSVGGTSSSIWQRAFIRNRESIIEDAPISTRSTKKLTVHNGAYSSTCTRTSQLDRLCHSNTITSLRKLALTVEAGSAFHCINVPLQFNSEHLRLQFSPGMRQREIVLSTQIIYKSAESIRQNRLPDGTPQTFSRIHAKALQIPAPSCSQRLDNASTPPAMTGTADNTDRKSTLFFISVVKAIPAEIGEITKATILSQCKQLFSFEEKLFSAHRKKKRPKKDSALMIIYLFLYFLILLYL